MKAVHKAKQLRAKTVSLYGHGDYRTVQEAIIASRPNETIRLSPGVYFEHVIVPKGKRGLQLIGEDATRTVITFCRTAQVINADGKPYGTSDSASVVIQADGLRMEHITFENSAGRGKYVGQAVAIKTLSDRLTFRHCRFLGWQDTLYATGQGRQLYQNCYIEGDVDFIFGHAAAVFEQCTIHSKGAGYITAQARDTEKEIGGYVFQNCVLTAAPDVAAGTVYLGRPWRDYARVVYINCVMGAHIRPEGWDNWRNPAREKTAFFAEIGSQGNGANPEKRVAWARTITPEEALHFAPRRFLKQK
jgi:pectinesterase